MDMSLALPSACVESIWLACQWNLEAFLQENLWRRVLQISNLLKALGTSSGDRWSGLLSEIFFHSYLKLMALLFYSGVPGSRVEVMRRQHGGPVPQLHDYWEEKSWEFHSEMLHSNRCQRESRGLQYHFQWWAATGITGSQAYSHFYVPCIPCELSLCTWNSVLWEANESKWGWSVGDEGWAGCSNLYFGTATPHFLPNFLIWDVNVIGYLL